VGVWDYRALTGAEIEKLESDGQSSRVGMFVLPVREVFSAVVATAPSSNDRVAEIQFSSPSGDPGDVLVDMTCLVGTAAGGYDVGICRVRKPISGSRLYLGETSDIAWAVGQHLTVIEDWQIWARHVRIVGSGDSFTVYMDWDVGYTDQYENHDPVPVMGAHIVKKLTGATVDVTEFDAGDSWVLDAAINSYSWEAPGASATSGMTTANPTLTYNAPGWYRVSCTVGADNGKSATGHRWVRIYDADDPPTWIELESCSGDWGQGGWTFRVTGHYDVGLSDIRNRALVILFAEDFYDGVEGSVGIVAGRENILAVGWIAGETIVLDPRHSTVQFEVQGPQFWLNAVTGFPAGIEDTTGAMNWVQYSGLTVRRAVWAFLHWRSTVCSVLDVFPPDDETPIGLFNSGLASLWAQIGEAAERTIKAHPACDRLGRLYVQVDSQLKPESERSSIPVVMDILKRHWRSEQALQLERVVVSQTARVDLSGVAFNHATNSGEPYFSLAPGHVMKRLGNVRAEDHLALTSQAQANELAGLICGKDNNPYPNVAVPFAINCRVWDICPHQYGRITVAESDNVRGVALTNLKLIPRRVSFALHQGEAGAGIVVDVDFEGYTTAESSVDGDVPPEVPAPPPPPVPSPIPIPPPPPTITDPAPDVVMMVLENSAERILVRTTNFQEASPSWAITLSSVDAPHHYRADYQAQTAYSIGGGDTWLTLYRIHDFNTNSPTQSQVAFRTAPGVIWTYGGYRFNNLAVATDDPNEIAIGVKNHLTSRARFHVSHDGGDTWTASNMFPSETNYYNNNSSGVWCVYPKPGATRTWFLIAMCGWYGPFYVYEITDVDIAGAGRVQIEESGDPLHDYDKLLVSGMDGLTSTWFRASQFTPQVVDSMFKGNVSSLSLTGPFQAHPMIPYSVSSPAVILSTNQARVYRSGWEDMGTTGLITSAAFIAPCALDNSLRWAIGGSGIVVDTVLKPPIVKYTANGGADDGDWLDKTGNLHTLLDALEWNTVDVHTIIPVLGGGDAT